MRLALVTQTWSAERCAALLHKAHRTPEGWKACCPVHDDKNPSLFLADGKDGLAAVCYAGCDYRQIIEALETHGAVLYRDRTEIPAEHFQLGAYSAHWDYRDAGGRVLMRICRWEQPGGKKDIRPLIRSHEGWKWGHHPTPRPLFQLDRLANEPDAPVIIVEGEKTAMAAQKLFPHHIATTWAGGADSVGNADWSPLKGRALVLVPDCDGPGRKAMAWVHKHVSGLTSDARMVDPARHAEGLPEGWDLADALREGRDVSGWLAPEKTTARLLDIGFTMAEAQKHLDLPYLIKSLFDRGQVIVFWGAPGSGKTFAALHMACHIGAGKPWAGLRTKKGQVLYICAESTRKRLENRVMALREKYAELAGSNVLFVPIHMDLLHGESDILDVIAAAKAMEDIALVVIDTLSVTFGGGDENSPEDMGQYVANLKRIKAETGAAVMVVHHAGKDESRGMRGHSALLGALDAELTVERVENPPEGWPTRILKSGKLREGLSNADLFAFSLEPCTLGQDSDCDAVSTCVVVPSSPSGGMVRRPSVRTQSKLLALLEAAYRDGARVWTDREIRLLAKDHISRNTVSPSIIGLSQCGFLKQSVGGFVLGHPPLTVPG